MAQVNSVQREPSMEEILASIRRIIEDSDGVRKAADETSPPPTASELASARSAADAGEVQGGPPAAAGRDLQTRPGQHEAPVAPRAELESFRAELGSGRRPADRHAPAATASTPAAAQPQRPAPQPEADARTFRLAEIQAQLAREAAAPRPVEPEQKPLTMVDIQQEIATSAVRSSGRETPAAAQPGLDEMELRTVARQPSAEQPALAERIERPAPERRAEEPTQIAVVRSSGPVSAAESQTGPMESSPAPVRQSIISPAASRQVAAAFGELSEAFAARSKKTFDELAEQMLRPMLQEWLDNNLPLLVERLVREEIERVARGS